MKLLLAVLALCQATSETRIRSGGLHKYFMSGEHFHYYSFFFFFCRSFEVRKYGRYTNIQYTNTASRFGYFQKSVRRLSIFHVNAFEEIRYLKSKNN